MFNFKYVVNKESLPICRDAMIPYAKSLEFPYVTPEEVTEEDKNLVIDCGWKTPKYLDQIIDLITSKKHRVYLRQLDDCPENYSFLDRYFRDFILHTPEYHHQFISPYRHFVYNCMPTKWIPYHYEEADEIPIENFESIRKDKVILSGFNKPDTYPLRGILYESPMIENGLIDVYKHPGYSGRCWKGHIGKDYINALAQYKWMAVTTCYQDYELLKYIECAEAGCCPIGDIPKSYFALGGQLQLFQVYSDAEISFAMSMINSYHGAIKYREFIKSHFSKKQIQDIYKGLFR